MEKLDRVCSVYGLLLESPCEYGIEPPGFVNHGSTYSQMFIKYDKNLYHKDGNKYLPLY